MTWSEQLGNLLEHAAIFITALASLIIAIKAGGHAREARDEIRNHRNGSEHNGTPAEDQCST